MHGHSSVSALLVNAEVDSMGGVVDYGVDIDAKDSLLRSAIEKAQAELRHEYDFREKRRRELEFLENGGNPLDFRISHASISVQSTSITDQLAEQYVTSEAKGSFALAPSPHGDSVESSGRPGGSLGREPNIADNLLLFDGENSNIEGEKKFIGKRGNAAPLEQSSEIDGCHNVKESEDSGIFRLGFKRQAYARRNRSRSSRDTAPNGGSTDLIKGHSNRSSNFPSSQPDQHAPSSISKSKETSLNGNIVPKTVAPEDQLDMELDMVQTQHRCSDTIKDGVPEGEADNNQGSHGAPEEVPKATPLRSSNYIGKEAASAGFLSASLGSTENIKGSTSGERVNASDVSSKDLKDVSVKKNTGPDPSPVIISDSIHGNSIGDSKEHSAFQETVCVPIKNSVSEKSQLVAVDSQIAANDESRSVHSIPDYSSIKVKDEMELCEGRLPNGSESLKLNGEIILKSEKIQDNCLGDRSHSINKAGIITSNLVPNCEPADTIISKGGPPTTSEKLAKKAHEDAILKEARAIEANLRRAGKRSMSTIFLEKRKKCHWDFVLEEMAWMATDFTQERRWKAAAAAKICRTIAVGGLLKFEQESMRRKQRSIARTLAKGIMHFWHSAESFRSNGKEQSRSDLFKSWKANGVDAEKLKATNYDKVENPIQVLQPAVQGYAVRLLDYISSTSMHPVLAEAPTTPDRTNDAGIIAMSWEDQLSEESLFYIVPPGAMQAYRESVESRWGQFKVNGVREEECEVSICNSVADGHRRNAYDEDATESGLSSKHANRKRKIWQQKSYAGRLYEVGGDLSYEHCVDRKYGNRPGIYIGKRPSDTSTAGLVPTKRVRTASASRQRVVLSTGPTGSLQVTSKTDVSSGDTNSFQDDQSSPHGGSHLRMAADFDRQYPFDGCEISSKSKKKKKPKHLGYRNSLNLTDTGVLLVSGKGSLYEKKLPLDSMVQFEQRDHVKKQLESHHFESNGNLGHYGQQAAKKPKLSKQLLDTSPEAIAQLTGSMPSPVASQMSNMSGQNKLIKSNKDRGRKSKGMKISAGQSGSGNPWTNFEEQALVVLVHDMGTNWELISDAINSTLQFKRVFRTPGECKERHKFLMESSADGADSAEDSGSSQRYRSTLPGIPKGSARQLFQCLQAPVEEDTVKAHFEKIILIAQKLPTCRNQIDTQDMKKITPAHSSHVAALSQMCPNNLSGGVLTPLDLCEAVTSSSDVLAVHQGSHTSGLSITSHQSSGSPALTTSNVNSMFHGSPTMVLGTSQPSPSGSLSAPARDSQRYGMPRPTSLPSDDQQRMQQYSQMIPGRNIQQSSMSISGALPVGVDRSVRMLPGSNGMGMMGGMNRGMPMPRPGFQGMNPPGMLNMVSTGSMLSGNGVGMQNPANVHPSAVSGPGNSLLRPRDTMQMLRPGQNPEEHRQMMIQEFHLQASQGNCQPVPPFNGLSASFSNATIPPPVQAFPVQQQQSHQMPHQPHVLGNSHHPQIQPTNNSTQQHQAYARLTKERQLQQRMMPQPQHQFSGSQAQSSSPGTPAPASSQAQLKHQQMPRNAQLGNGMPNPMMKQRQRQQAQQQQPRPHHQQRQQSQQQAKVMKGLGRGNVLMHQNLPVDGSHVSGHPSVPKNMQQSQGFFSGNSVLNPTLPLPSNQQKMYPRPPPQSSKQISPMPSHPDNPNQGSVHVPVSSSLPLVSQRNMQRMTLQQNRQMNSDSRIQSSNDQAHVNQIIPAATIPQCTDSSASVVSSGIQWKPESSYDAGTPTSTAHVSSSPQENLAGAEALMPSSSQGLGQRQFSGSVPLHKHGIGVQWPQQQQPEQQQHRQTSVQGNLYARSSNSGSG